jgi:FkbM family methyltransferase
VVSSCQIPHLPFIFDKYFGYRSNGTYVEVGAFDGISFSNTSGLAEAGWRGLLIEPVPEYARECEKAFSRLPLVTVHNLAISSKDEQVTLYVQGALTTSSAKLSEQYSQLAWAAGEPLRGVIESNSITLDAFLSDQKVPQGFELLVVDVEGHETKVFEGFTLSKWRPQMLIVELADLHPDLETHSSEHRDLRKFISNSGYAVIYKDHINTIFIHNTLD